MNLGDTRFSDDCERLRKEQEEEFRLLRGFRDAVIEALIVNCIYQKAHDTDANKAVSDLVAYETSLALDTQVSRDAVRLVDRGLEQAARICESAIQDPAYPTLSDVAARIRTYKQTKDTK